MPKKSPTIIILGSAGAGKGTQVNFLLDELNLQIVEAGKLVRTKAKEDSPLGREVHEVHKSGRHLPDDLMTSLMKDALDKTNLEKGLIVDGFPRSLNQAKILKKLLYDIGREENIKAIWIKIPDEVAIERLLNRSVCVDCRKIFATRDIKKLEAMGHKVEVRDYDQDREAILKRIKWFHDNVMPAIKYYQDKGMLVEIDGDHQPERVHQLIIKGLSL